MVAATAFALPCFPAHAADVLPDLVADPPVDRVVQEHRPPGGDPRMVVRFNGFVHNAGLGDLVVQGTNGANRLMGDVVQRISTGPESSRLAVSEAELRYEETDSHRHWHLMRIAEYALVRPDADELVAPAHKVGFCLVDSDAVDAHAPPWEERRWPNTGSCEWNRPGISGLTMGLTAGYRDVYGWELLLQWVDASAVQPGLYRLRSRVDPHDEIVEANEINAPGLTTAPVVVPGHLAKAQSVEAARGRAASIRLTADTFEHTGFHPDPAVDDNWTPGAPEFKVVDAPDHGSLSVAAGEWFSNPDITYTPDHGAPDGDAFTFVARDSTAPAFPTAPAAAAVALSVGGTPPPPAISGAPGRMVAGTAVQLTASMPVTWTTTAGTVTAGGLYSAPSSVPADGRAVVLARTATGQSAEVAIGIDPVPPPPRQGIPGAPLPKPIGKRRAKRRVPTLRLTAARRGPHIAAGVRVRRAGRVRVSLLAGKRRVRTRVFRAVRGRTYSCRLRALPSGRRLRVHAVLVSRNRRPLGRSVMVKRAHRH